MSNNYVKKYEVGNARIESPYNHYIYEFPLLTFGDVLHTVNLSLVFNSRLIGQNPFYMSNGYKLNLQKRLILLNGGPSAYEDGDGSRVNLIAQGNMIYTFDDDSQRIIRGTGQAYILEKPDYSTETYTTLGKITSITDKYGETILSYEYTSSKLTKIKYREGTKAISITYNNVGVNSIKYLYNGETAFEIGLAYNGSSHVMVSHPSGVTYYHAYSGNTFTAYSGVKNEYYYHEIKCTTGTFDSGKKYVRINKKIGTKDVDTTTYTFMNELDSNKFNLIDITNFHNITTRVQYINDKPAYSYEYNSSDFPTDQDSAANFSYTGDIAIYNENQIVGMQTYASGDHMLYDSNRGWWDYDLTDNDGKSMHEHVVISGWLKKCTNNTTLNEPIVCTISVSDLTLSTAQSFIIKDMPLDEWVFFTVRIKGNEKPAQGLVNPLVSARLNQNNTLLTAGFKITPQYEDETASEGRNYITHIKNVAILPDGRTIDFNDLKFYIVNNNSETLVNNTEINRTITLEDVLKYQISRVKSPNTNEIYCNSGKSILSYTGTFTVDIEGVKTNVRSIAFGTEYFKGERYYLSKNIISDGEYLLTVSNTVNGEIYSEQKYNSNFDLLMSTSDGITTEYARNDKGLVINIFTADVMCTSATYDGNYTKLLTTTDEFGNQISYTTDDVWGVITKTSQIDGPDVTDSFDNDFSTKTHRCFEANNNEIEHTFGYSNGYLSIITNGEITYNLAYQDGTLSSVSKYGVSLENRNRIRTSIDNKLSVEYPTHKTNYYMDNYDRVVSVTDENEALIIENTYNATGVNNVSTVSNGSSRISSTKDYTTGNTTNYTYDKDKLSQISVFNSSNVKTQEESFTYDSINRQTMHKFAYSGSDSEFIKENFAYETDVNDVSPDNRVSHYEFKVHNNNILTAQKEYDAFKRVKKNNITVGANSCDKEYNYDLTKLSNLKCWINDQLVHNYLFATDGQLRTTIEDDHLTSGYFNSYEYDSFGQLTRENNQPYGKTIVYSYDEMGNVSSAEYYPYTTETLLSDNPEKTDSYSYHNEIKDRLLSLNNKAITYDENSNVNSYSTDSGVVSCSWSRGKLSSVSISDTSSSGTVTFTYDAYGKRIRKNSTHFTVMGDISSARNEYTQYTYDSFGRLIREVITITQGTNTPTPKEILYIYDGMNVEGMLYTSGETTSIYSFDKNLRGDVVGVLDNSGNVVVKYAYDAYGNCKVVSGADSEIATLNPFRYRGYYFDLETGLYYLNARYYNPEWRRFISPDDTAYLDPESVNGLNLYAYGNNDPVNCKQMPACFGISVVGSTSGTIDVIDWAVVGVLGKNDLFNQTIKGSFREGLLFGKGSITGLYADWNPRFQISLKKRAFKVGIAGKFSLLNTSGQIGFGTDDLNLTFLKAVGDIGTVSGMAGVFVDPKMKTFFVGVEAKATALSGRIGGALDLLVLQIEVGLSGELGSIGGQFGVGLKPTDDGKIEFYYGSGLALGVGWDYYIRVTLDELFS